MIQEYKNLFWPEQSSSNIFRVESFTRPESTYVLTMTGTQMQTIVFKIVHDHKYSTARERRGVRFTH
jgi:hypothetical protein